MNLFVKNDDNTRLYVMATTARICLDRRIDN